MQKNHLRNKTQRRGTKRVTVSRRQFVELASFNAQQRVFVFCFFSPTAGTVGEVRGDLPPQWLYGQQAQWQVKALTCCCRTYSAEAAGV